jgi:hypothetical protein
MLKIESLFLRWVLGCVCASQPAMANTIQKRWELPNCVDMVPLYGWSNIGVPFRADYMTLRQLCVTPFDDGGLANPLFNFRGVCNAQGPVECDFEGPFLILQGYCFHGCYCRKRRHRPGWKERVRAALGRARPVYPGDVFGVMTDNPAV